MKQASFRFYAELNDFLPPLSREHYDEFQRCRDCRQVYWNGSHHRQMERFLNQIQTEVKHGLL